MLTPDPWERGIAPAEHDTASGPVRVIPVTAAVRDADDRRQRAIAAARNADWPLRQQLRGLTPAKPATSMSTVHMVEHSAKRQALFVRCAGRCGRNTIPRGGVALCWNCRQQQKRSTRQAEGKVR